MLSLPQLIVMLRGERHLAERHLAERHLAERHLAERHLAENCKIINLVVQLQLTRLV